MNLACVMVCLGLWLDISRTRRFARATTLFGASALFFNFAVLRFSFFLPVTTDSVAFLLATVVLWAYVKGYPGLAGLTVLPAGFTWPTALPSIVASCGLRGRVGSQTAASATAKAEPLQRAFAIVVTVIALATFTYFIAIRPRETNGAPVIRPLLPLSILVQAAYVYWVAQLAPVAKFFSGVSVRPASLGALAVYLCIYAATGRLLSGLAVVPDPVEMSTVWGYLTSGLAYPGLFIVAATTFLGPWCILLILKFPNILAAAAIDDPALFPTVALAAVFVLDSESRHLTFFLPSVVYVMCRVLDRRMSEAGVVAFAWGSLLLSRFWLPMATGPYGNLLEFPAQILFMQLGPWMAPFAYAVGGLEVLVALLLIRLPFRSFDTHRSAGTIIENEGLPAASGGLGSGALGTMNRTVAGVAGDHPRARR